MPSWRSSARSPSSSAARLFASEPLLRPWLACVSQPPLSTTAMRGPSGADRNRAAEAMVAANAPPPRRRRLLPAAIPEAMDCERCACSRRTAKNGSSAYRSSRRAIVSSSASRKPDGAQVVTEREPRRTYGVVCANAIAVSSPSVPPSGAMARFSQPSRRAPRGRSVPFSSRSWPSKWDRSRYGLATAWTISASRRSQAACSPGRDGCRPNSPSSLSTP